MRSRCLVVSLIALAPAGAAQPEAYWTRTVPTAPNARADHAMAYDAARDEVVLFGGSNGAEFFVDTWTWNNFTWTQRAVTGPSGRSGAAMAYDRARQRVVMFGGWPPNDETWAWDGTQWTQLHPAQAPVPRTEHAMVYDEVRQRVVLFGGYRGTGQAVLGDTWEWDGSAWLPRFSAHAPTARRGHAMAYDVLRRQTVLAGGNDFQSNLSDVWTWDGVDWTHRTPTTVLPARSFAAMTYFGTRQCPVLVGGQSNPVETWLWENGNWQNVTGSVTPEGPSHQAMAYHETLGAVVMFGGVLQGTPATWVLRLRAVAGLFTPFGQSCVANLRLGNQAGAVPRVGATFTAELSGVPSTTLGAVLALGGSNQFLGPFPLPLRLDFLGMSGCSLFQDVLEVQPMAIAAGTATWTVPIPDAIGLAGARLFVQSFVGVPGSNPAGVVSSNAAEMLIGT